MTSHLSYSQVAMLVLAASCSLVGCARNARLDEQVDRLEGALSQVDANGALRCAPRQLAIARSHLEFAELERQQGFSSRAEHHLKIADEHLQAAQVLSPPQHCASRLAP